MRRRRPTSFGTTVTSKTSGVYSEASLSEIPVNAKRPLYKHNTVSDRTLSQERPHVMLNQFPCESLVTVKDCLAAIARRARGGLTPDWLPETFNLQTELPQFVKHYQQRQQRLLHTRRSRRTSLSASHLSSSVLVDLLTVCVRGEDNHWICKPWNLARGLDTHITNNLDYIIRQRESTPKVPAHTQSLKPVWPGVRRTLYCTQMVKKKRSFPVSWWRFVALNGLVCVSLHIGLIIVGGM